MASDDAPRDRISRERWAAQIAALDGSAPARPRREPLSAARIVAAALGLVETEGYAALTMRRVATALGASPGALYVHVRDQYIRYPGISAAALAAPPHSLDRLRINEGLLAILLAGGVP